MKDIDALLYPPHPHQPRSKLHGSSDPLSECDLPELEPDFRAEFSASLRSKYGSGAKPKFDWASHLKQALKHETLYDNHTY